MAQDLGFSSVFVNPKGIDHSEYIEFIGSPGYALQGLSLVVIEGDVGSQQGRIERRLDFTERHRLGRNGRFLLGSCPGLQNALGVRPDYAIKNNFLENSTLTLAIVPTHNLSGKQLPNAQAVVAAIAFSDGGRGDKEFFNAHVVGPIGRAKLPAGARWTGKSWQILSAAIHLNAIPMAGGGDGCKIEHMRIGSIQGAGPISPYHNQTVSTAGVVTHWAHNRYGFWLQDPQGDAKSNTSDGLFVHLKKSQVRPPIGSSVTVVGSVHDKPRGVYASLTQIQAIRLTVVKKTHDLPKTVAINSVPDLSIDQALKFWESLEGMRIRIDKAIVVSAVNRHAEVVVLAAGNARPGSGYSPKRGLIFIRSLGINKVDYNPERILIGPFPAAQHRRLAPGSQVASIEGVVDYSRGQFKIRPTRIGPIKTVQTLPNTPIFTDAPLRVATFNVDNLLASSGWVRQGNPTLEIKLNKLVLALQRSLHLPEIVLLQEVQNERVMFALRDRLNRLGSVSYQAAVSQSSDRRGIRLGLLWNSNKIQRQKVFTMGGAAVRQAFGPHSPSPGREPLVARLQFGRHQLELIGLHLKSKRGDDPLLGANQPALRPSEVIRQSQARAVRRYIDARFVAEPGLKLIVAGDLNDFTFAEPGEAQQHTLNILSGNRGGVAALVNVLPLYDDFAYSYIYKGNAQLLDHILVSSALEKNLSGAVVVHINAAWGARKQRQANNPMRSSDHDPLVVGFNIRP